MTLTQFVERVRRRHNAVSDTNWSDAEIYQLITDRCNEVLSIIGLLEGTDTSQTSTASTQAYSYPSNTSTIRQVNYKGDRLKRISFRQWEAFKDDDSTTSGTPTMFTVWNRQILLIPIPDTSSDAITIYYYKEHPEIDNSSQTTIDLPAVLHSHLVFGVLADMFAKDLNPQKAGYYEGKWLNQSYPAFYRFKSNEDDAGQFEVMGDADTDDFVGGGIV